MHPDAIFAICCPLNFHFEYTVGTMFGVPANKTITVPQKEQ